MSNQYPEIRPTVVQGLLPCDFSNPNSMTDEQHALFNDATDAELKKVAEAHATAFIRHMIDEGVLKQTSILDVDFYTLYALNWVMKNLYLEWSVWPRNKDKKLGDMLKIVDPEIAADCMWWLRRAGLLPEDSSQSLLSSFWEDDNGRSDPPAESE